MDILIDTHIFLCYINGERKLKKSYKEIIESVSNNIYLSAASVWECVIKSQIGKLDLPEKPSSYLSQKRILHQIESLTITEETINKLEELPPLHKDPFDRIIIAQAIENNFNLITEDKLILAYDLPLLLS